jgi:hypothetical protein
MLNLSSIDLGWVAGFLEGEGYFSKGSSISVQASQVQLEPLERLQKLLGGSIHKYSHKGKPTHNDFYKWGVHGMTAEEVMKLLFPLMSPKRQKVIAETLYFYSALPGVNLKKSGGRKMCGHNLHPWIPENLRIDSHGNRYCHLCKLEWQRKQRASVVQEAEQLVKSS